jgi:hypothetical protein
MVSELDGLTILKRIPKLIKDGYILEFTDSKEVDLNTNMKDFFIKREKRLKEAIVAHWKL